MARETRPAHVLRHKALAGLAYEKNLLAWIATDAVDDVLPLLAPEAADFVREYQSQVMDAVSQWETKIGEFVAENADLPRKDFAMKTKEAVPARLERVPKQQEHVQSRNLRRHRNHHSKRPMNPP